VKEQEACLQLDGPVYPISQSTNPNRLYKPCAVRGYVSKKPPDCGGSLLDPRQRLSRDGTRFSSNQWYQYGRGGAMDNQGLHPRFQVPGTYDNCNIGMRLMQVVFRMA